VGDSHFDPLCVGGSKIRVYFKDSSTQEWDFGISGSSPTLLSNTIQNGSHLKPIGGTGWEASPILIRDMSGPTSSLITW